MKRWALSILAGIALSVLGITLGWEWWQPALIAIAVASMMGAYRK